MSEIPPSKAQIKAQEALKEEVLEAAEKLLKLAKAFKKNL